MTPAAASIKLVGFFVALATTGAFSLGASSRSTSDWQADLISVLIERQMPETAVSICRRHFAASEPRSEAAARWAIRWSGVEISRMLAATTLSDRQIAAAKAPLTGLLQSYEQHQRQLWLRTQVAMVDFAAARHAAVAYAVAHHRSELQAESLQQVSATLGKLDEIDEALQTELSQVARAPHQHQVTSTDLLALQQNIGRQRVAAYLLRSQLFAESSDDAIAAATQAVEAADLLLTRLQSQSSLRSEVLLLKTEAVYRAGDSAQAEQLLDEIASSLPGPLPNEALALRVRIATERDAPAAAEILENYYGSEPASAPLSVEMDLARLRWLLTRTEQATDGAAENASTEIANWLDQLERRGGLYARRRGEAETLARMRVTPGSGDVRLLAAEAAQRLRQGDAMAAADLLVQAAAAGTSADQSLVYARQAAAAFLRGKATDRAAEILLQTSRRHREATAAAKAHLQAIVLTSQQLKESGDADVKPISDLLAEHLQYWPQGETTQHAEPWLLNILEATGKNAEAARFLLERPGLSQPGLARAGRLWRSALRSLDDADNQQPLVREATERFTDTERIPEPLREAADWQALWTNALFGTRAQLQSFRSRLGTAPDSTDEAAALAPFIDSLVQFRVEGRPASAVQTDSLAAHRRTVIDAVERLLADGIDNPGDRRRLGEAMLQLLKQVPDGSQGDVDKGGTMNRYAESRALVWTGDWQAAANALDSLVEAASSRERADTVGRAALIMSEGETAGAKQKAVDYWNRLARGLPKGTQDWHQAKLAVAQLLIEQGETERAQQICQFVLLTQPPDDADTRAEYESILQR